MKNNNQKNSGRIIIFVFSLIPVLIWLTLTPFNERFGDLGSAIKSIGQISGLVGTVLFSFNLILATRHKLLEKIYFGMNQAYISHHYLGGLSLIMLLIHPLALGINYLLLSLQLAAQFLLPEIDNPIKTFGIISLMLMMILLVLTFYFRPRYDIWKLTHKFLGLSFFFAGLHVFFVQSDVSNSLALRYYMLFFLVLGFLSIIYKIIFGGSSKWKYKVSRINETATGSIYELELEPQSISMPYESGQFIFISFKDKNISSESHPFSISSDSAENILRIVIKTLGDYTSRVKNISIGAEARIEGPFGKFNYKNFANDQIWIAGGIGITPFLGMAKEIIRNNDKKALLFYSVKTRQEAVFLGDLEKLSAASGNFRVIPYIYLEKGNITAKAIEDLSAGQLNKDILLCGPPPMMKSLKKQLADLGVKEENIHTEEFSL